MQRAEEEESYIVFIDETGFMLGPLVRRTWAPRGQTPVIRVTTPHERISGIGAMTIRRSPSRFGFHFHLPPDKLNFQGHSTGAFLSHLRQRIRVPITIIWDEISIHSAAPVKEFLSMNPSIEVIELPPYAPELNPVDYVWAYVKLLSEELIRATQNYHGGANECEEAPSIAEIPVFWHRTYPGWVRMIFKPKRGAIRPRPLFLRAINQLAFFHFLL